MENFRIESLEINKIGAFEHIKMDFPKKTDPDKAEIHILTGENGTGKSTVLMLLASMVEESNDENYYIRRRSKDSNYEIFYKYKEQNHNYFSVEGHQNYPNSKKIGKNVEMLFFAYSGYRKINDIKVLGPKEITGHPLDEALNFNNSANPQKLIQWIVNTKSREFIAKGKGDNQKAKHLKKALNELEKAISTITNQTVTFDVNDNFDVLIEINKLSLIFDVLPDGLKSMISWLGDLLMRMDRIKWKDDLPIFDRNFILFLDEIEVHLHPAWQRKILPVVQKLFKNAQIFISTHSPFVVGSVDGAWVHKLKKGDDGFAVLDGKPVLSEDGKSVRRILDEVFGINQQYGVEVEKDLARFREIRQQIIMGQTYNSEEFNDLVKHLASQSTELEQMMGMEMNQLKRITQKELV